MDADVVGEALVSPHYNPPHALRPAGLYKSILKLSNWMPRKYRVHQTAAQPILYTALFVGRRNSTGDSRLPVAWCEGAKNKSSTCRIMSFRSDIEVNHTKPRLLYYTPLPGNVRKDGGDDAVEGGGRGGGLYGRRERRLRSPGRGRVVSAGGVGWGGVDAGGRCGDERGGSYGGSRYSHSLEEEALCGEKNGDVSHEGSGFRG